MNPMRSQSEFLKIIAPQARIEAKGLERRIKSGWVYQNLYWEDCKLGQEVVCDEKGCCTVTPSLRVEHHEMEDMP